MDKSKKIIDDKTKELLQKLENGIKETMNSERYKNFLKFQSQFHSYSANNQMLIYLQRPNATMVAGYKAWEKFDRHVMKGEKGISILAPNTYKYQKEIDRIDPKTKQPIKDKITGEVIKDKIEFQGKAFRKVSVFDVAQTDGKELPSICKELDGNSLNAEGIIKAIKEISETPIVEKVIESGAKGYYSRLEDIIVINKGMAADQTVKTLIHEYAHSKLHNTENASLMDRATKEVQAESVAYIVSNRFGVDTSVYSFDYLANWSSGKELKELKESLSLIQKTSDKIITSLEDVLNKEMQLQNNQKYDKEFDKLSESGSLMQDYQSQADDVYYNQIIKEKIVNIYSNQLPAIKHINENTAIIINNLNESKKYIYTIKEIKDLHNKIGKKLETTSIKEDLDNFKMLTEVIDDIKQSKLSLKQEMAHEKALEEQLNKPKAMEMV